MSARAYAAARSFARHCACVSLSERARVQMWVRVGIGECSRAAATLEKFTLTARARSLGEALAARG
eukprot:11217708-Lingulodinium_polyedra.AAC.1